MRAIVEYEDGIVCWRCRSLLADSADAPAHAMASNSVVEHPFSTTVEMPMSLSSIVASSKATSEVAARAKDCAKVCPKVVIIFAGKASVGSGSRVSSTSSKPAASESAVSPPGNLARSGGPPVAIGSTSASTPVCVGACKSSG